MFTWAIRYQGYYWQRHLVGAVSLANGWNDTASIGYWVRASAEGKGYASEAVRLIAAVAFERCKVIRLEITCEETNTRSARVAERMGFQYEGTLRNERRSPSGKPQNSMVFSLLPEEYERLRPIWEARSAEWSPYPKHDGILYAERTTGKR